jgi:hypothetical protein
MAIYKVVIYFLEDSWPVFVEEVRKFANLS